MLAPLLAAFLMLAACREDEDETLPAASDQAESGQPQVAEQHWLEPAENEAPVAFLSRVTGAPGDRIAPLLERLAAGYGDSPRMIANRTAQLWQEIRQKDDPPVPIETLLDQLAAGGGVDQPEIGRVIHHYRVLRGQGGDHAAAMAAATSGGKAP